MTHFQTIAMARGVLAEGRTREVARMIEPLIAPPSGAPDGGAPAVADDPGQVVLRCLLARVRLLRYGDAARALALLAPFGAPAERARLAPGHRAEAALWLGWMHSWPGPACDAPRALRLLDEAERHFAALPDAGGRGWALLGKAHAYLALDACSLADHMLAAAEPLHRRLQDPQAALWRHDLQVAAALRQGRYARAGQHLATLEQLAQTYDDPMARGRAYAYRATLYDDLGHPPPDVLDAAAEAVHLLTHAVVCAGPALQAARCAQAGALLRRGAWEAAARVLDEAGAARTDPTPGAATRHLLQARLLLLRGRLPEAAAHLDDLLTRRPDRTTAARAALLRSAVLEQQGDLEAAVAWAERALQTAREAGPARDRCAARLTLARLHVARQQPGDAHRHLDAAAAEDEAAAGRLLPLAGLRLHVLGRLALLEDRPNDARVCLGLALAAYEQMGDACARARIQALLGRLTSDRALLAAAAAGFERLGDDDAHAAVHGHLQALPAGREADPPPLDHTAGAALTQAACAPVLVAAAWLRMAAQTAPAARHAVYRRDEDGTATCLQAYGTLPDDLVPPAPADPHAMRQEGDRWWMQLRGHPGPAFFFVTTDQATCTRLRPWLPVAGLALDHALRPAAWPGDPGPAAACPALDGFVHAGAALREAVGRLRCLRPGTLPVLLLGEHGTGTSHFARLVHAAGAPPGAPFVSVDCAGVPPELLESHLFGHDGTARESALRTADGGTLVLEAVDALPLESQARLLRALQAARTPASAAPAARSAPVHARVVAITHRDLGLLVREGQFLEALYDYLGTLPLRLPPLRERRDEIPLLVRHFLDTLRAPGTPVAAVTDRAMAALLRYDWPGNVRQLRNEIERALTFAGSEPAPLIDLKDLSPALLDPAPVPVRPLPPAREQILQPGHDLDDVLAGTERVLIERVLAEHGGQVSAAADVLGLTRQGLYKKIKRLGIDAARFQQDKNVPARSNHDADTRLPVN